VFLATRKLKFRLKYKFRLEIAGPARSVPITVTFDHDLPFALSQFPQYAQNLGRVAAIVARKYPTGTILDIGANVGDSIAMIRAHGVGNIILGAEADPVFFAEALSNAKALGNTKLSEVFISTETGVTTVAHDTNWGNGIYRPDATGKEIVRSITIEGFSAQSDTPTVFIKTDTEGYDLKILSAAKSFLASAAPVLFFEYLGLRAEEDASGISLSSFLASIRSIGYSNLLLWNGCNGDFVQRIRIDDDEAITDFSHYARDRFGSIVFDIGAFHSRDADLFDEVYKGEVAYFDKFRESRFNPAAFLLAR
jgi:FkbM family methyltransferase